MTRRAAFFFLIAACASLFAGVAPAPLRGEEPSITVASTTSTENSGLFEYLLPKFEAKTGIKVKIVAVGTGQAIGIASRGDADVLFVHHKPSELAFVAAGEGVERFDVMYNDFVIVGPDRDPAGVKGLNDAVEALKRIAAAGAVFISRGDDSGTNKLELELWQAAGIDVMAPTNGWYRAAGAGMGATLNTAAGLSGYTLTDRATWLNFHNRGPLAILVQGDARLFNQYGVTLVNPRRHPAVKAALSQAFVEWLISAEGQEAIAGYRIDGQQLFFPNANSKGP